MVQEISDACRRHGLKFGTYLSPWDRNHKDYGRPEYLTYYRNQLRELLSNYGPIFEVWFDGANGGDGYYGGARDQAADRQPHVLRLGQYLEDRARAAARCLHVQRWRAGLRWVGNEQGFAGETCWATLDREGTLPGLAKASVLGVGQGDGTDWLPAEVDVSIRPGWFYHAKQDSGGQDRCRSC